MSTTNIVTGGCLCGAVRYRITAAPLATRICWCRVCQHLAAGNASVNLVFPRDALTIEGTLNDYVSVADSGSVLHRRFCPACGVHVLSEAEPRPHLAIVRAGTLDDPQHVQPTAAIWCASAPAWAHIDGKLQRFERQPPPS